MILSCSNDRIRSITKGERMNEVEISKPDRTATFMNLSSICFLLTCVVIYISTILDPHGGLFILRKCGCGYHLSPSLEILRRFGFYLSVILLISLPADGVRFGILGMKPNPTLSIFKKVSGTIIILLNLGMLLIVLLATISYLSYR